MKEVAGPRPKLFMSSDTGPKPLRILPTHARDRNLGHKAHIFKAFAYPLERLDFSYPLTLR